MQQKTQQALGEQDTRGGDDSIINNVFGSDEVVLEKSQSNQEPNFSKTMDEGLILISDNEDINHLHSLDNNSKDYNNIPQVKVMKPLVLPSGAVVEIEKDL